ncbi:MAG: glycoside hydrolase family 3 N-terminal domain-containing protein, partial [Anaerolineales bacterium]
MIANIAQKVHDLLKQMTVEEKLVQLGSYWMWFLQTNGELDNEKIVKVLRNGIGQITRLAGASTLTPAHAAKTANHLQKFLLEETRLGIPALIHEECCSGMMMLGGTQYPQMIGLASTFQPNLAEEMTTAIRRQMMAVGGRQGLAPVLDLGRDPRWGRTEETFGEDPTLASHFGMAYVRGLQGEDLAKGLMATGKHFIAHSMSQGGLNCGPVHVGMNELYDVYMTPFQAAIRDAKLASIMNSYPELDSEVVAASRRILTELLRNQLGFEGLVVSDYNAIDMLFNYHFVADDLQKAAVLALNAGIDVELPAVRCYGDPLKAALEAGEISLEVVDQAVERHLTKKFELGLFDNPYVDEGLALEVFETPQNRATARKIAQKSMVLLKNDGLLPLDKQLGKLAVIGPNAAVQHNLLGDYSYHAKLELQGMNCDENSSFYKLDRASIADDEIRIVSVLEGIRSLTNQDTEILYAQGCEVFSDDVSMIPQA